MALRYNTTTLEKQRWMFSARVTSVIAHGLLLSALLYHDRGALVAVRSPGTAHGSRVMLTYSPGRAPTQTAVAALKPAPSPVTAQPKLAMKTQPKPVASSNATLPGAANPNASTGGDALGLGNVTVALATFFPTPRPDLSQLPRGTRGDVVIDVTIDELGRIVESKVDQSLGHGVDETVMATIQTWTFKPATKDGKPVASEQQLLFHYERG